MKLLDNPTHSQPSRLNSQQLSPQQLELLGEILDQLLVQAEAGQAPDIESACARHPDLASAIRHYVRSMQLLHNAAHAKPASSSSGSRINLLAPPERQLGDYRLVREIGRGGMGIVYEAEQQSLARRVALKILPFAAVLDGRQIARFQNEAQAAASLHHPHIVPVYAVGQERGTYYYSMQYIDGQTLEFAIDQMRQGRDGSLLGLLSENQVQIQLRNAPTLIATGPQLSPPVPVQPTPRQPTPRQSTPRQQTPLACDSAACDSAESNNPSDSDQTPARQAPATSTVRMDANASTANSVRSRDYVRRVAAIGIQAAQALHFAHQHGIIHRDIKPSNLMLDAHGSLWVTDFGLAQCASSGSLTASGDVIGTLRYMSPEQAAGRSHLVDHRTDVYALGATLYELLTLRAVVDAADRMVMVRQIENESPRGPRRFNSAVPVDLENIVVKAICKSRDERYTSADELAADLKRFLDGQTPLARRPNWLDHSARWVRRHAKAVAVSSLVALVMLVGSLAAAIMLQSKNREIAVASAQADNHLLRANEAIYRFGHSLMHRLELLPGSEEMRLDTARDTVAYFRAFASYARQRTSMHADVARALMICGDLEMQLGEINTAVDHYRQAHELWSPAPAPERAANQLLCRNNLGTAFARLGQLDEARQTLQAALKQTEQFENSASTKANALSATGTATDTATYTAAALHALLHLNLGHVEWELHGNRAAQSQFASALKILDRLREPSPTTMATLSSQQWQQQLLGLMAAALVQSAEVIDNAPQARSLIEHAIAIHQQRHQAAPTDMAVIHDLSLARLALGAISLADEDVEDARRLFHKAVVDMRRLVEQHPAIVRFGVDLASALNNLGQAELESQAYAAAEQNFVESKSLLERLHQSSEDYWIASNLGGVCNNLAVVKEHQGQRQIAEQLLNEAIRYQELALTQSPDSARCREFLTEHRAQLARLTNQQP